MMFNGNDGLHREKTILDRRWRTPALFEGTKINLMNNDFGGNINGIRWSKF